MEANNNKITCPKCNSQNVQSEGMIHLCMDCGYKWEDEVQTDLGEMIIYQSDEGVRLDVRLENKTVWLNQEQIGALFNKSKATISEHISNIFKEGELNEKVVVRKFRTTTQHGALEGKTQSKDPPLVRVPVNSFEFHSCERTPQVDYLLRLLRHRRVCTRRHLVIIVYGVDYQGI